MARFERETAAKQEKPAPVAAEHQALIKFFLTGERIFRLAVDDAKPFFTPEVQRSVAELRAEAEAHKKVAPPEPSTAFAVTGGGKPMQINVRGIADQLGDRPTHPELTSEQRTQTTIPQQQLFALNSPFMVAMAQGLAERLGREAADDEGRVRLAWRLAYGRSPTADEVAAAIEYLETEGHDWNRLCHALLMSNEFAFLP